MGIMVRKQTAADQAPRPDNQICLSGYSNAYVFYLVCEPR